MSRCFSQRRNCRKVGPSPGGTRCRHSMARRTFIRVCAWLPFPLVTLGILMFLATILPSHVARAEFIVDSAGAADLLHEATRNSPRGRKAGLSARNALIGFLLADQHR